ncbi:MAG: hypothetical protein WC593_12740 [Methanoregula sp.]
MGAVPFTPLQRTRIIFFLIVFAAALWAVFLIRQGEIFQFSLMFALIAGLNPVFVFLDVKSSQKMRGWIFFYLIVLVAMLWATFLMLQGVLLWVSLLLFIVVSGMCLVSLLMEADPEAVSESS